MLPRLKYDELKNKIKFSKKNTHYLLNNIIFSGFLRKRKFICKSCTSYSKRYGWNSSCYYSKHFQWPMPASFFRFELRQKLPFLIDCLIKMQASFFKTDVLYSKKIIYISITFPYWGIEWITLHFHLFQSFSFFLGMWMYACLYFWEGEWH